MLTTLYKINTEVYDELGSGFDEISLQNALADDPSAYEESINFWCSHALVYDPELMRKPFRSTWEKVL